MLDWREPPTTMIRPVGGGAGGAGLGAVGAATIPGGGGATAIATATAGDGCGTAIGATTAIPAAAIPAIDRPIRNRRWMNCNVFVLDMATSPCHIPVVNQPRQQIRWTRAIFLLCKCKPL